MLLASQTWLLRIGIFHEYSPREEGYTTSLESLGASLASSCRSLQHMEHTVQRPACSTLSTAPGQIGILNAPNELRIGTTF